MFCYSLRLLQVVREQKLSQQKQDQEDRIQRNLDRAAAPAFQKKKGKPDMSRSILSLKHPGICVQVVREQKLSQQKQDQEDRIQRNLDRAAAPAFQKKKGKPDMSRSTLLRKTRSTKVANESADAELDKFLSRDFSRP